MFLPQGGLAVSIASTVWVGAVITALMNLFLGWSLKGLVVPGFLVPLFIIMPSVAFINILEGAITYLLLKTTESKLVYYTKIDSLFGREKYFAIILTSVAVRVLSDSFALPYLANFLQNNFNYQFDFYSNLNSYGIIVVALIANRLWNEGLAGSILPLLFTILITYLIVRYGLIELGAFKISQIQTLYSNIEEIFPASAKSYIILISAILIAIKFTANYGWDYGGMLVVGLLSLQWYSPARICMTILEAIVISCSVFLILKLDCISKHNFIGPKKVLLFFNIGFIYRILLGNYITELFPEDRIIEYYGYGYLISTLIALQIDKSQSLFRSVIIILWTSIIGFIVGSLIALILYFISGSAEKKIIKIQEMLVPNESQTKTLLIKEETGYFVGAIRSYKNSMDLSAKMPLVQPSLEEIITIDHYILKPLSDLVLNSKSLDKEFKQKLAILNFYAANFGYEIVLFSDLLSANKFIFLAPIDAAEKTKNWGLYIFRLNSLNDRILQVPKPFDEINSLGFAIFLFQKTRAGFLFIGGTYSGVNQDRSSDLTRSTSKASLYAIVNQVFLREHHYKNLILQIRGYGLSIESKTKPDSDILVAYTSGAIRNNQLSHEEIEIINIIRDQGLSYRLVNGDEQTIGYEVGELFLSKYLVQTSNKDLGVLWLSPQLRKNFADPADNYLLLSYYQTLNIETIKVPLTDFLKTSQIIFNWEPSTELKNLFEDYIKNDDIVLLQKIAYPTSLERSTAVQAQQSDKNPCKIKHLILTDDGKEYIAFYDLVGNLLGIASLRAKVEGAIYSITDYKKA